MKKLMLMACLLAALSVSQAQTTFYWPDRRATELTDGTQYMIYNTAVDGDRSWFLYSNGSALMTNNVAPQDFITTEDCYLFRAVKPASPKADNHWYLHSVHGILGIEGQTNNTEVRDIYISKWFGNINIMKGNAQSEDEQGYPQNPNEVDTKTWAVTSGSGKNPDPGDNTYAWNGNATAAGLGNGWTRGAEAHPYAFYTVGSRTLSAEAAATYNEAFASDGKVKDIFVALQDAYGLVKDATQYNSNWKEPTEGSYEALLDGNGDTYFHSTYSMSTTGAHYLRADLGENKGVSAFSFAFRRRSQNNNNRPTQMTIYGSNDDVQYTQIAQITSGLPTDANDHYYFSQTINSSETYRYIKFEVNQTNNGTDFFTFSEFYILSDNETVNEAYDVIAQLYTYKSTSIKNVLESDLENLGAELDRVYGDLEYAVVCNEALALLADKADKVAVDPAIGQYDQAAYEALENAVRNKLSKEEILAAMYELKMSLYAYVFRITSAFSGYSSGCSICDDNSGTLKWSKTDAYNKQQLWKFENAEIPEITEGDYVVININTGRTFWDTESITVSRPTDSQPDGVYIITTKGNATPVYADQIGVIVRRDNTNADSPSAWKFEYVGTSAEVDRMLEEIAAQEERDKRMSELLVEAKSVYDSYSEYIRSEDNLITQASQILSNAAQNSTDPYTNEMGVWGETPDGGGYPALIDNDPSTYFHSAWQGSIAEPHYLQVTFTKPVNMYWLEYRKHNDSNRPTKFAVYGARADADISASESWEYINDITLGTGSDVVSSDNQMLYKNYGYLRFVVKTTNTGGVLNGYPYMAMSEFQLHPVVLDESCLNALNPRTSGNLLSAIDTAMCVPRVTDEDIASLESSLAEYQEKMSELASLAGEQNQLRSLFEEKYAPYFALLGDSIGEYHSDIFENTYIVSKKKLEEAPEDLDISYLQSLETIMNSTISTLEINQPKPGHYYRFKNKKTGLYLASDGTPGSVRMVDGDDVLGTTFFFSDGNKLTGSNMLNLSSVSVGTDNGTAFRFSESSVGRGLYVISYGEAGHFWMAGNGVLDVYDAESAGYAANDTLRAWILEEVTSESEKPVFSLSVPSGYTTLAAPVALNIPDGVKAYTGYLMDDMVELTELTDGVIPASTPVIIESSGDAVFTLAAGAEAVADNELEGVYVDTSFDSEYVYYVFSTEPELGFSQTNAPASVGAFQAYLRGNDVSIHFYPLDLGQTAGIGVVTVDMEKAVIYDLWGRRVTRVTETGIYIVNGKKMLINKAR